MKNFLLGFNNTYYSYVHWLELITDETNGCDRLPYEENLEINYMYFYDSINGIYTK